MRFLLECLIAGIACYIFVRIGKEPLATSLTFPFLKNFVIDLGILFIPFGILVIVGTGNSVNLTDGLDGLAIVPVMIAAASFALIAYLVGNKVFAEYLQLHFVPGSKHCST